MYFTMVIDRAGAVCQAKTPLDIGAGDDLVNCGDDAIVWGNRAVRFVGRFQRCGSFALRGPRCR
jgi:hypothetical protein